MIAAQKPVTRPTLSRVAGVNVLRVRGDFYEMGHQHGAALADQIREGPVPYFKRYLERVIGGPMQTRLSPLMWGAARQLLGRRVLKTMPVFARQTLEGLADGAGLPLESLIDGYTMPDSFLWLASRMMQARRPGPAVAHRLQLGLGCTSAIAWGDATEDGRLLHARNFDFYGVGPWPSTTTVMFATPDEGQRYVSVGAAGVPLGGVTAMNEAGLTLTVHQHLFTDQARLGGVATGLVGDVVMRKAESLDDAEKILREHTPIGCWTYVVAKDDQVLCFEENPARKAVRRTTADDRTFGYANVYLDEALGETEVNLYPSYWRHNANRHRRANQLLEHRDQPHTPESMAAILADDGGLDCRISGAICMLMTVGSVVFRPQDGTLWVGTGEAPTSRTAFVPFSLEQEDQAMGPTFVPGDVESDAAHAFEAYRDAYLQYFDEADSTAALHKMRDAIRLAPDQPLYRALEGFLALTIQDAAAAHAAFDAALALGHPHEERLATFHLWRGRASDLAGDRAAAVRDYRTALGRIGDAHVHRAATKQLSRPYTARAAKRITIDFTYADVM